MKRGVIDGIGKIVWDDGSSYEGGWKMGKRDGEGVLTFASSSK